MRLSKLLSGVGFDMDLASDPMVGGIQIDSRRIRSGDLFVAMAGTREDGRRYLADAFAKGATAAIVEAGSEILDTPFAGALVRVPSVKSLLPVILDRWHGGPLSRLRCMAVTGTNGKSTTVNLISSVLRATGDKVITLGTIENRIGDSIRSAGLTTPDPIELFDMLSEGVQEGCRWLVMEASSHALDQDRILGLQFERAVFTNLTQDHLDYHPDMDAYFAAKRKLFTNYMTDEGLAIVNLDSPYGLRLADELGRRALGFSQRDETPEAEFGLKQAELELSGTRLVLRHGENLHAFASRLIGSINLENLTGAASVALSLGIAPEAVRRGMESVQVRGRNEIIDLPGGAFAIVDYAHTPDALERVLSSIKALCRGRVSCVFGCGGDRDRGKRPQMGRIAATLADRVVVTSDNPRTENPQGILEDILRGIDSGVSVQVEPDRRRAIRLGLDELQPGDCLLIAGKGHEDYQILSTGRIHFSDQEEVATWLASRVQS